MLSLPGVPSISVSVLPSGLKRKLKHVFKGADPRVCVAFWLFGLINNVLYVIILSAALDLVGPDVPKGVVLLADVIPSFLTKLVAPYFIQKISYPVRILAFVAISVAGMLLISLTPGYEETDPSNRGEAITTKMVGVMLASLSSGGGELSFVSLVHYYGPFSLAAWGSGTGGAGLVGAGVYALATTVWGFSVKSTLVASAALPGIMLISFFGVLPRDALESGRAVPKKRTSLSQTTRRALDNDSDEGDEGEEGEGLLQRRFGHDTTQVVLASSSPSLLQNLLRAKALFLPYMLPLLLVYIAEYTINQGVAPTLLFPLRETPFKHFRAFYPTYNAIYQCGVFISRSSTPFFRVHNLYLPSFLQVGNLILLTAHSMFDFIPSVYLVFLVVFWEGLLGGLVYVNTFAEISDNVEEKDREFSLGATTVSDSGGICVAGLVSMGLEVSLCSWQVERGKDWCRQL